MRLQHHIVEGEEALIDARLAREDVERRTRDSARLERCDRVRPGDYLFIPAGVPHVAVNRTAAGAQFLGARNDPAANEGVVLMTELDAALP